MTTSCTEFSAGLSCAHSFDVYNYQVYENKFYNHATISEWGDGDWVTDRGEIGGTYWFMYAARDVNLISSSDQFV